MKPHTPLSKGRSVVPTTAFTPQNAKKNDYASGFGNSRLPALVSQAWDLRGSSYLPDACEAVVDEFRRLKLEWRHEENLWCEQVLRSLSERVNPPVKTFGKSSLAEPGAAGGSSASAGLARSESEAA